ncbi:hypothetical protein MBLNU13_g11018t1 [Cladosporium sp. NU13]
MTATIKEAIAASGQHLKEACAGNDTTGDAHLTLSGADEQIGPWEDVWACRLHLDAAVNALADCNDVYKEAGDVQHLQTFEAVNKEERSEMQKHYHALSKRAERR